MIVRHYLLDTNVVSEIIRVRPDPNTVAFLKKAAHSSVSVMVFHELECGCEALTDPVRRARVRSFIDDVKLRFAPDAWPISLVIAEEAARLRATSKRNGRILALPDSLIAATALTHELILVTRNVKDFTDLDVPIVNPFEPV